MKKKQSFIILLIILVFFSLLKIEVFAQKIEAKLTQDLMIGLREDSTEYMFSQITTICIDSKKNIYIGEKNNGGIRVFNDEGTFIREIGGRGQGPGEFIELTDMTIDPDDNIITLDRRNRRVSIFICDSDSIVTVGLTEADCIDPYYIRKSNNNSYMIYYREEQKIHLDGTCDVFHMYDQNLNLNTSFGDEGLLWPRDDSFMIASVGEHRLKLVFVSETEFWAVPGLYRGRVIRFIKVGEVWNKSAFSGFQPDDQSYVKLSRTEYIDYEKRTFKKALPTNCLSRSGPLGHFLIRILRQTRGIFILNNGSVVHFSEKHKKGDIFIQMIEFFNQEGDFLGYSIYNERDFGKKEQKLILRDVLWKDNQDRFYFSSIYKGIPVVIRMSLDYSFN